MGRNDEPWEDQPTTVQDVPVPASVRLRAKKPFALEQVAGPGAPREHLLESDEIIVGRSQQANISVDGNGISRTHAAIRKSGPEYTFTDLNSANGVYLNGIKTHSAVLREGDMLQLGDAVFVFHEGS
ncbi:MAG TPA: FHA domain-containing protein [Polyangiaceae bacterium]|nr:FHA domain-containing protein [Polyangiaceae bacterium]